MNIRSAVRLYCNEDPAIQMECDYEERAEEMGPRSVVKEAFRLGSGGAWVELNFEHLCSVI